MTRLIQETSRTFDVYSGCMSLAVCSNCLSGYISAVTDSQRLQGVYLPLHVKTDFIPVSVQAGFLSCEDFKMHFVHFCRQ